MTAVEILIKAKDTITNPSRWCKDHFALDSHHECVSASSYLAERWCAAGALARAGAREVGFIEAETCLARSLPLRFGRLGDNVLKYEHGTVASRIVKFNDDPTVSHRDIMILFDRAIELAKKSESQ